MRPNGFTTISVEAIVMPTEHVLDHRVIYFTLSFKHFEHFMSEKFFKLCGFGGRTDHESAVVVKATIGGENM